MGIKDTIERMRRILLIASKPDKDEYKQSVKIIGLGFVIIGIIGFLIFMAVQLMGGL
ncbi:MAG: protein translocase SEC61 complex subunit gamma [Candidatus Aenigmarchaeota archaeon]|nr:protein translocase SEC61 complex subunit gamma [Candidatus Aenigmarchaeota archaeon]